MRRVTAVALSFCIARSTGATPFWALTLELKFRARAKVRVRVGVRFGIRFRVRIGALHLDGGICLSF